MPNESFDTIVVGARCAGASLAVHLARGGQRVLLLDAARLPSDQPMSTHVVSALGVEWLDELGVGAEVRRLSPPIYGTRLNLAGTTLDVVYQRGRPAHGLRRLQLDGLLQDAAVAAGAELRDRTKVAGLVREGDRVVGVDAVREGVHRKYSARLVVGADGRHSTVAELASAKEYFGYDNPRFYYWAYWPANPAWTDELRSIGTYFEFDTNSKIGMVFQTDGGLLLIGVAVLQSELPSWKGRFEEAYLEALRASPLLGSLVEGNAREGKIVGLQKSRFFFRQAVGPGYALVGDAGLHKDPLPGYGITDALRDARNLGRAILAGGDDAQVRYWRQRDVDSIDLFHFARDMADPSYVNPLNQLVFAHAQRTPELLARASAQADREISPYAVVPVGTVLRIVAGAVLGGRLSVVPAFLAAGKRGARADRARRERVAALASLATPSATNPS